MRKIFILYPYYWPLYKAGGPVQSLFNIVGQLKDKTDFYIISKNVDIDGSKPESNLATNNWTKGPQGEHVYYASRLTTLLIYRLMSAVRPDIAWVNGMFNLNTSFNGLLVAKWLGIKIIISPRGMLQSWGLKRNERAKRIYLSIIRQLLKKNELWHATDNQEKKDILTLFGEKQIINVASNIPRTQLPVTRLSWIKPGEKIRLLYLSLINRNKNLCLVIESIKDMKNFSLKIYGPVIDSTYWEDCKKLIDGSDRISYEGAVPPWEVPGIIAGAHFFVLPTQGENFGHAIFDSLSVGTPVIVSRFTPWSDIDSSRVGFYIDINSNESLQSVLNNIAEMTDQEYAELRERSYDYAREYGLSRDYRFEYDFLLT